MHLEDKIKHESRPCCQGPVFSAAKEKGLFMLKQKASHDEILFLYYFPIRYMFKRAVFQVFLAKGENNEKRKQFNQG